MAPFRPEEITLPARFLCKVAHLVAVLTVLFDVDEVVAAMLQVDSKTSQFKDRKKAIEGICYAAIACFSVDFISLFLGISMFFPFVMALNIIAHFCGTILVVLFYTDHWDFEAFIAFFAVFNAAPMVLEILVLVFVTKFSFLKF